MFSWLRPRKGQPKIDLRIWQRFWQFGIFRTLKPIERFLLVGLFAGFIAGVTYNVATEYHQLTVVVPSHGGQYTEGVVGNRAQLDELITRLTSVGLVSLTAERAFVPVLVKDWTISPDGKAYTFHLVEGVASEELASVLKDEAMFKTVEVQTPDPATLVARLKQPFGPFLSLLALPIFPSGPYVVESDSPQEVTFVANENFPLGKPFLDRITIQIFANDDALEEAVRARKLTGFVYDQPQAGWIPHQATLPRTISAIFNVDRAAVKNGEVRRNLLSGKNFGERLTLTIVTTPQLKSFADEFTKKWSEQNVEATLRLIDDATLRSTVIPNREYDVLIYGVDEGIEPDPYRFWHSSQATSAGLNLAQLKDRGMDSLLDEARKIVPDEERFKKYAEIEQKLEELAVRKVLNRMTIAYQVSGAIKGVEEPLMVNPASRYNLVWKWYTKERRVPKTEDGGQKTD